MNHSFCRAWLVVALMLVRGAAQAGTDEAIVYGDELNHRGEIGTELYANMAQGPALAGKPGAHVFHALGEFSFGLSEQWSLAAKLPVTRQEHAWHADGAYAELKYVNPHDAASGWYWGAELEAGRVSAPGEERATVAELAPIVGCRTGRWHLIANPGFEYASEENERGWSFQPRVKASYAVRGNQAIAVEYYAEAGHLPRLAPRRLRNEVAYLAWDTVVAGHKLSAGIGRGMTPLAQRWAFKLALEFDD